MTASMSRFYVTIATPKGSTTKKVVGEILSVGRADDCNLSISHETMSRRHLSVIVRNGECWIEDHGSANGTFVNGYRVQSHSQIRVQPEDQVELAQSGIKLLVSTEPHVRQEGLPPIPKSEKTLVVKPKVDPPVERRTLQESQQKAEMIVLEAYKKSSHLVHEAEIEAERRVEDIYRKAHETQKKADEIYQDRLNEAYRSAEDAFSKAQAEAMQVLGAARNRSIEMRDLTEKYAADLRGRAESDSERILAVAQSTARDLKINRLIEADEITLKKEQEIVAKTTAAMNDRLAKFEDEIFQTGVRRRTQIEESLQKELNEIEKVRAEVIEKQRQITQLDEDVLQKNMLVTALRTEVHDLKQLRSERNELAQGQKVVHEQLTTMRAKLEKEKTHLALAEKKHFEELRHETEQKVRTLEREMLAELENKKDMMGKELVLVLERHLKESSQDKGVNHQKLETAVTKSVHEQLEALTKDKGRVKRQKSLASMRRRDKFRSYILGVAIGISAILVGQRLLHLNLSTSPVDDKITKTIERQRHDLEMRKYTPPQTPQYKATYVDNVLYTQNFIGLYMSDDFQDALLAEMAPYMFRTWRLDEDKVIQLLSMSTALVKGLTDKKDKIHPDFVQPSIDKMRAIEAESRAKMVAVLGSQVRYESFKKVESRFYSRYLAKTK